VRTGNFVIAVSSLVLTLGAILVIWGFDLRGKYGFYPLLVACAGVPVLAFGQFYQEVARARFLVYLAFFPQFFLRQALFLLALSIAFLMEVPINALIALSLRGGGLGGGEKHRNNKTPSPRPSLKGGGVLFFRTMRSKVWFSATAR